MENESYEEYLNIITEKFLKKFFNQQKEYICCKEGCSLCCETGQYPFSKLEFDYAMKEFQNLSDASKKTVYEKVKDVKIKQKEYNKKDFMYECPFLINKRCSIYNNRAIICRTHGLMFYIEDETSITRKIPNCVHNGLNFSKVFDENTQTVSSEKIKKYNFQNEPFAYNISLKILLNNALTKQYNLDFGEEKALIDWFD